MSIAETEYGDQKPLRTATATDFDPDLGLPDFSTNGEDLPGASFRRRLSASAPLAAERHPISTRAPALARCTAVQKPSPV
ncbi:MAG: hypothetical protein OEO77_07145 [Acidimicrobiia bacterium]|nr:hypothetical protein [Acidimicrobiia bacterium]